MGGGKRTEERALPKNSGPLQKSFWSAQSWIFVQEKESNDTRGGWKTYRTRGGPKPLFGRGVLREVFLPPLFSTPPMASSEKRLFLRLFCDFGPGGPRDSCKWSLGSQCNRMDLHIGNGNSARSFSDRSFFEPPWGHGRPRLRVMDKCLFFQDSEGLTEVFAPGRPPGYPRGRPPDIRPQNLLFGLLFRS